MKTLHTSHLQSLPLLSRGKVRDIYAIDDERLLILQSDRISAFDVVMADAIPNKGLVLTEMSKFWFHYLADTIEHHQLDLNAEDFVLSTAEKEQVQSRSMVVRRLKPLPIEAVCRGYLIGSGWKDYQQNQSICGIKLPTGLQLADKLPENIFTPSTKAILGEHDENISFEQMANIVGIEVANEVRRVSLNIYQIAVEYARAQGNIIIADTKFEFALDEDKGTLILIDEVLTPDSSRYWPLNSWKPGVNPESYDKQYLRDWLEQIAWDKKEPTPKLLPEVIAKTESKYLEIKNTLCSDTLLK